jgi:hypothetical protein
MQGLVNARNQNHTQAVKDFQKALIMSPGILDCAGFQEQYQESLDAVFGEIHSFGNDAGPRYLIQQPINTYFLYGYDLDTTALERGGHLKIDLYWSNSNAIFPNDCEIVIVGDHTYCTQSVFTKNFAANAGFEWGTECRECDLIQTGYGHRLYDAPLKSLNIYPAMREETKTMVLALENSGEVQKSGVSSSRIPVASNEYYLQAGWLRAENGSAWLGRKWFRENLVELDFSYVAVDINDSEWTHYATVVRAPEDARIAEIMLLNYEAPGTAYFDNVLLAPLGDIDRIVTP